MWLRTEFTNIYDRQVQYNHGDANGVCAVRPKRRRADTCSIIDIPELLYVDDLKSFYISAIYRM